VIHILVLASQEYVNIYSTYRARTLVGILSILQVKYGAMVLFSYCGVGVLCNLGDAQRLRCPVRLSDSTLEFPIIKTKTLLVETRSGT